MKNNDTLWLPFGADILKVNVSLHPRFCGNVAPPTVNTNSSTVWVTFRSDGSIGGSGFTAQYHAITPEQSEYWARGRINRYTELIFALGNRYVTSATCVCVCASVLRELLQGGVYV